MSGKEPLQKIDSSETISPLEKSIVVRTGSALVGIALMALLAMFGTMFFAENLEGDAQAINLAGSMRMQSYRIANAKLLDAQPAVLMELITEFEDKLESPFFSHTMGTGENEKLDNRLDEIKGVWRVTLKPILQEPFHNKKEFMEKIDSFVALIDLFVRELQESSESEIRALRALQSITVFVVVLVSFIVLYNINKHIAIPLKDLVVAAQQIREGNFKAVSHYKDEDELGLLAKSFNQMSAELEILYLELEDRVKQKTLELQRSNNSLEILYNTARKLYSAPNSISANAHAIFEDLEKIVNLGTITLCLSKSNTGAAYRIITSNNLDTPSFCQAPNCDVCRRSPDKASLSPRLQEVVSFPLGKDKNYHGDITVEIYKGMEMTDWQRDLMNAIADIFLTTLTLSNHSEQESRIALMEERAVIARELHDSLAQSLSYQKLQAARLKKLIQKQADDEQIYGAIDNVQNGLNSSYRQLRELLSTFRIQINEPGLEPALIGTVAEYREKSDVDINLHYELNDCPLTPNEEIHCLQIVREAVSNIVKHAQAKTAHISLKRQSSGNINIRIFDDGIGIPDSPHKSNHYGLSILAERTESLHGTIKIERREEGGTEIRLEFPPAFLHTDHNRESSRALQ